MAEAIKLPELDNEVLQQKVNEFALQGALKTIEEYYTGYNSPYRKAIEESLAQNKLGGIIELPDIVALINQTLSKEIDAIANAAVAQTFTAQVARFLTREEKEMKFSEFLEQFIKETRAEEYDDCSISVEEHAEHKWLSLDMRCKDKSYSLTLHNVSDDKGKPTKKYSFLSLPYTVKNNHFTMELTVGDAKLKLPYTPDILRDDFMSFVARLVISGTEFTMDCDRFSEEMFPDRCHC